MGKMLKRIDRVYQRLVENWQECNKDDLLRVQGNSASEIAEQLSLSRSNTSSELNKLVRLGKVIKIKTFPVRYLPVKVVEENFHIYLKNYDYQIENLNVLNEISNNIDENSEYKRSSIYNEYEQNPFEQIIGYNDSLKKAISQAKAAVYYPPHGLHMLLLGPTGSGKTFFANRIYQYACYEKLIDKAAPFETFNCADYYNNPQLLLSILFGSKKGAFTGAEEDTIGLIERANGGVLLLDEIHRLPPEGQEMLFYFIDNGNYNRLGESGIKRNATVLIICATTETPSSALLTTFLRRIPMTIHIPTLKERSLKEKIELVTYLFENEAKRIQKKLRIHIDVINALLEGASYGNVGQLKSLIQLVCAQSFLHNLSQKKVIEIKVNDLPEEIQKEWISSSRNIKRAEELSQYVDVITTIYSSEHGKELSDEKEDFNIYESIAEKVEVLKEEGIDEQEINQYIMTDLHLHIRNFVNKNKLSDYNLLKFVDKKIPDFVQILKNIAEEELNCQFDRRFVYYVSMHIDAFFKRGKKNDLLMNSEIKEIKKVHANEYKVAKLFKEEIAKEFKIMIPDIEVIYLTMLVASIETLGKDRKVSILVATHGNSTASSMVDVAVELLGNAPIEALDMPLTMQPEDLFKILVEKMISLDLGKGVLLLVDMGSLAMMEQKLIDASGVKIRTIANVTTSIVLDVVRKVNYMNLDLNAIHDSVIKDFALTINNQRNSKVRPKAIIIICTTGSGTAKKIETLITKIIYEISDEAIEVIPLSALKMQEQLADIQKRYQIIASVGTKNPAINAPFISLEKLVDGVGEKVLRSLLVGDTIFIGNENKNVVVKDLCEDTLKTYLIYLNPYHLTDMLLDWVDNVQLVMNSQFSNSLIIRLVVHTAFAFERVIKNDGLNYDEELREELIELLKITQETLKRYEDKLDLHISMDEKKFIAELLLEAKVVS